MPIPTKFVFEEFLFLLPFNKEYRMVRIASGIAVAVVALVLVLANVSQGQAPKKMIKIGDPVPAFTGLPGVDGKSHSLSDYKKDVVVLVITCNHCPVAIAYEDRIISFAKKFGDKVDIVAINVNNSEADKLPKMIERAKDKGYNFAYLYDESQAIARSLGATVTPHFFVLNKERKLVYRGAMDDNNNPTNAKVNYLDPAVTTVLAGDVPATAETKARGCGVQYDAGK
jgi:peroxiredoxin